LLLRRTYQYPIPFPPDLPTHSPVLPHPYDPNVRRLHLFIVAPFLSWLHNTTTDKAKPHRGSPGAGFIVDCSGNDDATAG